MKMKLFVFATVGLLGCTNSVSSTDVQEPQEAGHDAVENASMNDGGTDSQIDCPTVCKTGTVQCDTTFSFTMECVKCGWVLNSYCGKAGCQWVFDAGLTYGKCSD